MYVHYHCTVHISTTLYLIIFKNIEINVFLLIFWMLSAICLNCILRMLHLLLTLSRHKRHMEFKAALGTLLSVYDQIWEKYYYSNKDS